MVSRLRWYENGFESAMKRILPAALSVLILLLMLNCSAVSVNNPSIQRQWMLVSFGNYTKEDLMKNKASLDLTTPVKNKTIKGGAFMGCNRMFFTAEFKNSGRIKISDLGSTLMACENMKLEDDFSKKFKDMQHYRIEGHFLTLADDHGNLMKFIAADWD